MNLREHDLVVSTCDLSEHKLQVGDVDAVVHVYAEAKAFEVEFVTGAGKTLAVATLQPDQVRPLGAGEILHVRSVAAA